MKLRLVRVKTVRNLSAKVHRKKDKQEAKFVSLCMHHLTKDFNAACKTYTFLRSFEFYRTRHFVSMKFLLQEHLPSSVPFGFLGRHFFYHNLNLLGADDLKRLFAISASKFVREVIDSGFMVQSLQVDQDSITFRVSW